MSAINRSTIRIKSVKRGRSAAVIGWACSAVIFAIRAGAFDHQRGRVAVPVDRHEGRLQ
jgi:hypothetical protein